MKTYASRILACALVPALTLCGGAAIAQTASSAEAAAPAVDDIIVTARRTNERLSDVPVAVSVIQPAEINSKGVFSPIDLPASVPGLTVSSTISDRNNVTYTIRGQSLAFGTLFPAVVTYFNEVPVTQITAGQFFDVANVQVLRGPQGVSFGRVTDGGNVMINAQTPKEDFGGYLTAKVGNYALRTLTGAINVPIIADRVLFRAAGEVARRDGFTKNLHDGRRFDDIRYESFRLGLTVRPTDRLQNTTLLSFQRTHDNGTASVPGTINPVALAANSGLAALFPGVYGITSDGDVRPFQPGDTPFTVANIVASQIAQSNAQLARGARTIDVTAPNYDRRKNLYLVNTTVAELTDNLQLTNIFGFVDVKQFQASNYAGANGAFVLTCHDACNLGGSPPGDDLPFNSQRQLSEELRLSGYLLDGKLSWALGAYADRQTPGRKFENDGINVSILQRTGVRYTTTKSRALYGTAEYAFGGSLEGFKVNGGLRHTWDSVKARTVTYQRPLDAPNAISVLTATLVGFGLTPAQAAATAAATFQPIPHGLCQTYGVGSFLGQSDCLLSQDKFKAFTWLAGVSYKRGDGPLLYAKVSRGYRPGGVNDSAPPGVDPSYQPEFDLSVEIGAKLGTRLGNMPVSFSMAAFHDRYTEIQKGIILPPAFQVVRNVNDGTIKGIELEGDISPVSGLKLGGSFNYIDAQYDHDVAFDPRSCDPTAPTIAGFCPFNRFAYTPKYQYTLYANYSVPLQGDAGTINFGGNWYHQSSTPLFDTSRIQTGIVEPAYGYLNLNASWNDFMGRPIDLGFFMTNVTNKLYRIGSNNLRQRSSLGTEANIFAPPRMFGFSLSYRFGADAR